MILKKKTLALAESCTGGFTAHLITQNPGSSAYFLGSFVMYCEVLKQSVLDVKKKTLETYGAVSEEVVREMVLGLFRVTSADITAAISGIAGPEGGSPEKPVGTVWIALGERGGKIETFPLNLKGERTEVIEQASKECLGAIYDRIFRSS